MLSRSCAEAYIESRLRAGFSLIKDDAERKKWVAEYQGRSAPRDGNENPKKKKKKKADVASAAP